MARRLLILVGALALGLGGLAWLTTPSAPPAFAATGDVPEYLGGSTRTNYSGSETAITPSSAASLEARWSASSHGTSSISVQPVVANGVAYWGDFDGYVHATNATTGAELWSRYVGKTTVYTGPLEICEPPSLGVVGAASVATVGGHQLVFVPGGGNMDEGAGNGVYFYALNASDGSKAWATKIGTAPLAANGASNPQGYDTLWASATLSSTTGSPQVYVAVAAHGSCPSWTDGRVLRLDAATGTLATTVHLPATGPNFCNGSDIWGTPAVDDANGKVYVATGEADPTCAATHPQPYNNSLLRLDATTLAVESAWKAPVTDADDSDFGSTPMLFSGGGKDLVGVMNKNGYYYVFDRSAALSGGPLWSYHVAVGGAGPEEGDGSVAPAASDGTNVYLAGGTPFNFPGCATGGSLVAVNPADGSMRWRVCTGVPVLGAPAAAPGVVVVPAGADLQVRRASDGALLTHFTPDGPAAGFEGWFVGPPTISNGWLYAASMAGKVHGWTVPGSTTTTTAGGGGGGGGGTGTTSGYWMVGRDGSVYAFGAARYLGGAGAYLGAARAFGVAAVHLEPTPSGHGYWIVDNLGRVYAFGDAGWLGNADRDAFDPGELVSSLSATPSGHGYWIFTTRGRVLRFGDAGSYGDMSATHLNGPVLGSIATPSGKGYYMVASDGGIFAFGDAVFRGSMGGKPLNSPVQALVPTADNKGYWLVAGDGGIFAFGNATFRGSMGSTKLNRPVVGMVRYGNGYLMAASDGGVFDFSDQPFLGSLANNPPAYPITGIATAG
ncbi:MAG: PQQ-binding-like beta-propeller repeat protein [Acidimicrobiia bacterium]